jgi:hypothetical protein
MPSSTSRGVMVSFQLSHHVADCRAASAGGGEIKSLGLALHKSKLFYMIAGFTCES